MGNASSNDSEDEEEIAAGSTLRKGFPGLCTAPSTCANRDTVIIFDWDDTLMCSSAIKEATEASQSLSETELRPLSQAICQVLLTALELGRTAIVTNANMSWVRASCNLFLPSVLPVLQFVQILSARQSYQARWPGNFDQWKIAAFQDVVAGRARSFNDMLEEEAEDEQGMSLTQELSNAIACALPVPLPFSAHNVFQPTGNTNLVVLGDSMVEMRAGSALEGSWRNSTIVKTVKFKACPTVPELLGQLKAVTGYLEGLVQKESNLHKKLVMAWNGKSYKWMLKDQ